jgi:flavin reductase (DIM6/NTAB) family NADH-FMN oxidoreductase RutF
MIDTRAFRQAAAQFATGVTIIALESAGEVKALTANSFTSLSLEPPLVLFCLGRQSRVAQIIHDSPGFCVNVLAEHQRDLSAFFAGAWTAPAPPRFSFVRWDNVPRLEGCLASIACVRREMHEGGDHIIVVGEVTGIHRSDPGLRPLIFFGGGYASLESPYVKLEDPPLGIAWSGPWG